MDIKELKNGINPKVHWYYQSKKIPLFKFFEKVRKLSDKDLDIVDVGAGSGFFSEELYDNYKDQIKKVYLVDTAYTLDDLTKEKNQTIIKQKEIPQEIKNSLIILMDILEHIENDVSILKKIKENSNGENYFFITVPAFMSLWSTHDDFLGHYRRYNLKSLGNILLDANFEVENIYYIYGSIFPLVWIRRRLLKNKNKLKSDITSVNPIANQLLKIMCSFEMHFRKINKWYGVTCVAEGKIRR